MRPAPDNKAAQLHRTKDKRSAAAAQYRKWYKTKEWQTIRRQRFAMEPSCRFCAASGHISRATSCDHIKPHRGNASLFFDLNNTQSLCRRCHDSTKQKQERRGYSDEIGSDGLPVDPMHPFNKG